MFAGVPVAAWLDAGGILETQLKCLIIVFVFIIAIALALVVAMVGTNASNIDLTCLRLADSMCIAITGLLSDSGNSGPVRTGHQTIFG